VWTQFSDVVTHSDKSTQSHSLRSSSYDRSIAAPKPVLHRVGSSASSSNFQYPLASLRSSNSCLRLPPLLVTSIFIVSYNIIYLFTAIVLSPGGSGYFTCKQNMKLVTTKFKSGGLHEKHVVATWKVGNRLSIPSTMCFRKQFLNEMWPNLLTFLLFTVCRIFLSSLILFNTSCFTRFVQLIFILPQHHISKLPRYCWHNFWSVHDSAPHRATLQNVILY